ncbi:MAG: hypothetical protein ACE5JJ_06290 [Nitrospinota bacterium]
MSLTRYTSSLLRVCPQSLKEEDQLFQDPPAVEEHPGKRVAAARVAP